MDIRRPARLFFSRGALEENVPMLFLLILNTILLLLSTTGVAYVAYHIYTTTQTQKDADLYERRLNVYREIVRFLSVISRDGDISRHDLLEYRSKTQESAFLFDKVVADYIEKIHSQAVKLRSTNDLLKSADLPIGEERDSITVENSKQLIWLADQLPLLKKKFDPYLRSDEGRHDM
jgi:hypothetical protein